ncbi:hypothetical protein G5B00_15050 [Parapedobacter sp. SGR-10]|uniref:DUF6850 family outer membrane beta-barrel protein n=1 Tax=Parapedobacter sp. SGR-10 TaxID=2710879 RepID=UPI0013D5AF0A|nr:DUF6850 family outer membrane beta-barrel protein [Parapedobacter sp. SGR-10]NGF57835.1 hypothetical protein [Parapedobacter sp. SGR-10]
MAIGLLCCSTLGLSQGRTDSLYVFEQNRDWISRSILSPIFTTGAETDSYGVLQLNQQYDRGGLRMAQQAYDKRVIGFTAKGFNRLGRFKIGAIFQFNNQQEDSLSNSLRNDLDPLTTYYPYASKSGHYRRQNYILNASVDYRLNRYLSPYIHIDYHKHWTAGTVDPRLKSDRFIVKVKPGIAVHVGNHDAAAFINLGRADETVKVDYINDNFKFASLYPERIYYPSYGYGYSGPSRDSATNYKYDTYKGFGVSYQVRLHKLIVQAEYSYEYYHNTNQYYSKSSAQYTGPRAIFNLYNSHAAVNVLFRSSDRAQHTLSLAYGNSNGYDGSLPVTKSLKIVNYRVDERNAGMRYSVQLDKAKTFAKEFGAAVGYGIIDRKDLLSDVQLDAATLRLQVFANLYLRQGIRDTYKLGLSPYIARPGDVNFRYNALATTDFVRNVVNTDYHYYRLQKSGIVFDAEYMTRLFGKNNIGFYGGVDYSWSDKSALDDNFLPAFDPSGQRTDINLGVRMYINAR